MTPPFFFFFLLFFKYVCVFSSSGLNLIKNQIPSNHGSESVSLSVVSKSLWPHSSPGSSVHGILQARKLERVAISLSWGSSWPWDGTQVSCIAGGFFTILATREGLVSILNTSKIKNFTLWVPVRNYKYLKSNENPVWLWYPDSWKCRLDSSCNRTAN